MAVVAAAAAVFWSVAMRAVRSGEAPPKLPDARTITREARRRGARIRKRGSGSAEPEQPGPL